MNSQISSTEAASELLKRRNARTHFLDFTTYTKKDYEVNWHHSLICEYLDRFASGEIRRLAISMPPRTGKTELVSRRFPAYIFGRNPDKNIIACSYSADLSNRNNRDVQRIMDSKEYRKLFPNTMLSSPETRAEGNSNYIRHSDIFEIVGARGVYRSAGVGGGITGMGCDIGIIDDPVKNQEEALSATYREKVWEWYTSTFYTRLEKNGQILLTMTRWHEDDLAGRILKHAEENGEEWVQLVLPAISEAERPAYDERPGEGIALWENKYNLQRLEEIRGVLGVYQWTALYQQRPSPIGGGMWKYQDIDNHRASKHPELVEIVVGIDPAVTSSDDADETGIVIVGRGTDKHLYVIGDHSLRGTPSEWAHTAIYAYHLTEADRIVAEVNNGGEVIESLLRNIDPSIPYKAVRASRGKQIRAEPVAALYEQGLVHHVGTYPILEGQMCEWIPGEKSPDRMDALVWAVTELTENAKKALLKPVFMSGGGKSW